MRILHGALRAGSALRHILPALAILGGAHAADYYVSPGGRDTDPGTESSPWQTIAKASATMAAGDTVHIMKGAYRECVKPAHSGLPGQPITYTAYPGHSAVIDGTGVALAKRGGILGLVDIGNKKHIRISGLTVVNTMEGNAAGIFAAGLLTWAVSLLATSGGLTMAFPIPMVAGVCIMLLVIALASGFLSLGVLKKSQPADLLR